MLSSNCYSRFRVIVLACVICGAGYAAASPPVHAAEAVRKSRATVTLGSLRQTYDGNPKPATSVTIPAGLSVKLTYDGRDDAPVNAGRYQVLAVVEDPRYQGTATGTLTIRKAAQTITFEALTARTYGDGPFDLSATVSSGAGAAYTSSNSSVAAISGGTVRIMGAGTAEIIASQAGDNNHLAAKSIKQTLMVNKAKASVTLTGLDQIYDGTKKEAGARTEPEGLRVSFVYDKHDGAPTNAGAYAVIGTVQDANYEGRSEGVMSVAKTGQTITFTFPGPIAVTYGQADFAPAAEASSGLPVSYTSSNPSVARIDGDHVHIVGAGSSTIIASQAGDDNYRAAEQQTQILTVNKAKAKITLTDLEQTYDGARKQARAETEPQGLQVTLTYDHKTAAPAQAGSYAVDGTVQDANYEGKAGATLTIAKAPQTITFTALAARTYGDAPFDLSSKVSSSLAATYASSNPEVASVSGGTVRIVKPGTTDITAYQPGDENHLPAEPARQTLTVNKATAAVTLPGLDHTYDGTPKRVSARTVPANLNVVVRYDNYEAAPARAGTYTVVGTVQDANYQGSATAALTIAKARQTVTFDALAARTYGDAPFELSSKVSSSLIAAYASSNPAVAAVSGNTVAIRGAGTAEITAYQPGNENYLPTEPIRRTLTVAKAAQRISFNPLSEMTFSAAPMVLEAVSTSGLPISYESSNGSVATVLGNRVTLSGIGATTITAYQSGDDNHTAAAPVRQTLVVKKALAKVTLDVLTQVYDGKPKPVICKTSPGGLTVRITYNESDAVPVNAGAYRVVAIVLDTNYAGIASGTLTVSKAVQRISFRPLPPRTYGDETPYLLFASASSGLSPTYGSSDPGVAMISGNEVKITGAGTTVVTAYQPGDNNFYTAEPVQQTLTVKKAPETVSLDNLAQVYDGKPKRAAYMTSPAGLAVSITYDGSATPPVMAGSYRVEAVVQDARHQGSAAGTLTIAKAPQKINFPILNVRTQADGPFELTATASSGITPTFESADPAIAVVSANRVMITGEGTTTITAFQPGDSNYAAAEPVKRVLVVLAQQRRVAVLPMENLSGKPAPVKEIRQSIIDDLVKQGDRVRVIDEKTLKQFMARHRVRYIGGIDTATALAWKEEEGIDTVLISSVDQYEDSEIPKIALTARLVSTGALPYILWMENADLSGDDSPGLFGSGLIDKITVLQRKAVKQLTSSMARFYADRSVPGSQSAPRSFRPRAAFHAPLSLAPDGAYTVAVMPFINSSKSLKASDILALRFVCQLVKRRAFQVIDPGIVRQRLLNFRVIMPYGISRKDAEGFFNNVGTDLIVMGRVLDYQEGNSSLEFSAQVYERTSGAMIWSSWSHNQGNDGVVFFDAGRINNIGGLVATMINNIVKEMSGE